MKNSYSDNKYDIFTVNDILKESTVNILEKKDDRLLFEFGDDFFKLENNKLTHYPDFVSMKNNVNFKDATETDYGFAIIDSINKSEEINNLKNYELKERESYIKEEINKGLLRLPFKVDPEVEKSINKIKDNKLPAKELEDVNKMIIAVIDVTALLLNFFTAASVKNKKNRIITDVIESLNRKNATSLSKDYETLNKVPEVKKIIEKYFEFGVNVKVDKDWKNFQNKIEDLGKITDKALGDNEFLKVCQNLSDSIYKEKVEKVKNKVNDIVDTLANEMPELCDEISKNLSEIKDKTKKINDTEFNKNFVHYYEKEIGLDPRSVTDNLEFLISNNFICKRLFETFDEDYNYDFSKLVHDEKDFDELSIDKMKKIIEKLSDNLLDIKIDNKKDLNIKR